MRLYLPDGIHEFRFDGIKRAKVPFKCLSTAQKFGKVGGYIGLVGLVAAGIWYYEEAKSTDTSDYSTSPRQPDTKPKQSPAVSDTTKSNVKTDEITVPKTEDSVFTAEQQPELAVQDSNEAVVPVTEDSIFVSQAEVTSSVNLPKGLKPGSYEISPGVYNAHSLDIPDPKYKHTVERGDTLWKMVNDELTKILGRVPTSKEQQEGMVAVCMDPRNPGYLNWEPGKCCQRLDINDVIVLDALHNESVETAKPCYVKDFFA